MISAVPVAALAAAATAAAGDAEAAMDARCYVAGRPMTVSGAGFVPNAPLAILGGASPRLAMSDRQGALAPTRLRAPAVRTLTPRMVTIRIRDVQDATLAASMQVGVVREPFDTNAPIAGTPAAWTTWRFAGFTSGQPIYGHFRHRGVTYRNHRFGAARGPCGTLVVRAPRVPVPHAGPGLWELKLDALPRYRANTPGRTITFRIHRPGGS